MSYCALVLLLVSMATSSYAEGYSLCDTSANCTASDSHSYCLRIFTPASCTKGFCAAAEPVIKQFGQSCTQTEKCGTSLTCNSGVCACANPNYTYRPAIAKCIDSYYKLYGEACTKYMPCVDPNGPGSGILCLTTTCQCATGYVYSSGSCHLPNVGEACAASTGCTANMPQLFGSYDTSQRTETCTSGMCSCPSNSTQYTTSWGGTSFSYCLATTTATLKLDGTECKLHNECASKICAAMCPADTSTRRCLRLATSGVSGIQATTGVILTLVTLKVTLI